MKSVLQQTKIIAKKHSADLAIPNCEGSGIGNVIVYTRLVEEFSLQVGRPITIFTGPLRPSIGTVANEDPFAIWRNNPFIKKIIDGTISYKEDLSLINSERRSLVQLNHIIENICWAYGLRPRELRSSLFLSSDEMIWALNALKELPRPLVCLHPGGNTKSLPGSPWHMKNWARLIESLKGFVGFFQVGQKEFGDYDIGLINPAQKLRETMALIWASDFFVGFDSGPMHIATAFRKPVVTIFDMRRKLEAESKYSALHVPSVMLRWSYPFNRNIAVMENDFENQSFEMVHYEIKSYCNKLNYKV